MFSYMPYVAYYKHIPLKFTNIKKSDDKFVLYIERNSTTFYIFIFIIIDIIRGKKKLTYFNNKLK